MTREGRFSDREEEAARFRSEVRGGGFPKVTLSVSCQCGSSEFVKARFQGAEVLVCVACESLHRRQHMRVR